MSISKEQWAKIEGDLKGYFASMDFQYKDTEIGIRRVSAGEGKTELAVFLNGEICGGWGLPNSDVFNPLVVLFWSKRQKSHYSPVNDHAKLHQIRQERSCKNDPPDSSATLLVFARDNLECFVWKPSPKSDVFFIKIGSLNERLLRNYNLTDVLFVNI